MEHDADAMQIAEQLYPAALLMLGDPAESRAAVIESIVAAKRHSPEQWADSVLPHLLRISLTRAPERLDPDALPEDSVPDALRPVLRLPAGSRISLALDLCGCDPADAAAARGLTADEQQRNTEKAYRQLQFLQTGDAVPRQQLAESAKTLIWQEADSEALFAALADAAAEETAAPGSDSETQIVRRSTAEKKRKTISVPVWCIAAAAVGITVLSAALIFRIAADRLSEAQRQPEPLSQNEVAEIFASDYLYIGSAQEKAADAAGIPSGQAVFLSTKLKTAADPPFYELQFTDGSKLYSCIADAKSGEVSDLQDTDAAVELRTESLQNAESLRKTAAEAFSLHDVIVLKEKLTHGAYDDEIRFELLDRSGIVHSVQLDAQTAVLLKYKKERLGNTVQGRIISAEKAKELAVARVSGQSVSEMIFTKVRQDGELYTVAFTMDDGTQYLVELNAVSGAVSNVDVHPVSADISDAVGMLAARDTALKLSGLSEEKNVNFTKAKIDRSSGIYVYELEFETYDYEYEVSIAVQDGTPVKFRAWETE